MKKVLISCLCLFFIQALSAQVKQAEKASSATEAVEQESSKAREKGSGLATGKRQHKPMSVSEKENGFGNDLDKSNVKANPSSEGAGRAQDYNSSRSNNGAIARACPEGYSLDKMGNCVAKGKEHEGDIKEDDGKKKVKKKDDTNLLP